jgi:hypothetical protein
MQPQPEGAIFSKKAKAHPSFEILPIIPSQQAANCTKFSRDK